MLTDEQVNELRYLTESLSCDSAAEAVRVALIEVQQTRARRCDRCHYWRDIRDYRVKSESHVGQCINAPVAFNTRPDFFCADFTPSP